MEDPRAPRRAAFTYALLSLVVRLIASQSAVFSLWYGRRAYERSRGEMITMLYEKTLSRKAVSVSSKAPVEENAIINGNGISKGTERSQWKRAIDYLMKPFRSRAKTAEKPNKLASMGKIMNLMR